MISLYRKYRPRTFTELVGQGAVVTALTNAVSSGQTVHAYLFAGPRGSGKTSMARLLAKALNCRERRGADPCNRCDLCTAADESRLLDLIEIDAASNRGIENMRDIRQQVAYAPSLARFKVYIIDEAHMLSKDAANAFLKTLEEPPPFVVFVLATTEVHKFLPTIVSRCQRYEFRKLDHAASLARLKAVAEAEKISIDDEALGFVIGRGDGSLRDMLGLLEQVVAFTPAGSAIDRETCLTSLGMLGDDAIFDVVDATIAEDARRVLDLLGRFDREGIDAGVLAGQLVEHLRRLLWLATGSEALQAEGLTPGWLERARAQARSLSIGGVVALLERISDAQTSLRSATIPYFTLELCLLRGAGGGIADLRVRLERLEARLGQPAVEASAASGAAERPPQRLATAPDQAPAPVVAPAPVAAPAAALAPAAEPTPAAAPAPGTAPAPAPDPARAATPARPTRNRVTARPARAVARSGASPGEAAPAPVLAPVSTGAPSRTKAARSPVVADRMPSDVPPEPEPEPSSPPPPPALPPSQTPPAPSEPGPQPPRVVVDDGREEPDESMEAQATSRSPMSGDSVPGSGPEGPVGGVRPPSGSGDPLKQAWERIVARVRGDSPRLLGILKEVVAVSQTARQLKLFVRRGHSFAIDTLRKAPPVLMNAVEQELGARITVSVAEDRAAESSGTGADLSASSGQPPDKGWIEADAVGSKAVQTVIVQLDAEIVRVD
jgi:DNA polymerase-3 subunit gamma/tau